MSCFGSSSDEEHFRLKETRGNKDRVIVFLDVDSFEYQVWTNNKYWTLKGRNYPAVVVNQDYIILSVNYPARMVGISREIRLKKARKVCLDRTGRTLIVLFTATKQGLVDTETPLRESDKIISVLRDYKTKLKTEEKIIIERGSIDEVYIDVTNLVDLRMFEDNLTQNELAKLTKARKKSCPDSCAGDPVVVMEGKDEAIYGKSLSHRILQGLCIENLDPNNREIRLIHGALIAKELMQVIREETGYQASFGVSNNKLRAKIACGLNKPEGITIMPYACQRVLDTLQFKNLPGFGGHTGKALRENYKIETLWDVLVFGTDSLERKIRRTCTNENPRALALDLVRKARLIDDEIVRKCYFTKSISQSISFKGPYTKHQWNVFKKDINRVSKRFVSKLHYQRKTHQRVSSCSSIKVNIKPMIRRTTTTTSTNHGNFLRRRLPTFKEVKSFVLRYMKRHQLRPNEIDRITLTASRFEEAH